MGVGAGQVWDGSRTVARGALVPAAASRRHVAALDGLRGAAVCAVIAFHFGWIRGGFVGVDVFFVLSGFLITAILHAEWTGSGRIDIAAFLAKRGLRLLPPLVLCGSGYAALCVAGGRPEDIAAPGLAALTGAMNYAAAYGLVGENPLGHTWSLAVEAQFYLVWPFLLAWLCRALSARAVVAAVAALAVAVTAWRIAVSLRYGQASVDFTYRALETRADALLIGAALALLVRQGWRCASGAPFALAGLLIVAVLWRVPPGNVAFHAVGFTAVAAAAACVVGYLADPAPSTIRSAFAHPALVYLGRISYGLYLYHYPILSALERSGAGHVAPVAVPVTLAAAMLSYHLVERPLLRVGARSPGTAVPAVMPG
jgi:peptidoglycan/LPS O-acetylase OafA/YrhL